MDTVVTHLVITCHTGAWKGQSFPHALRMTSIKMPNQRVRSCSPERETLLLSDSLVEFGTCFVVYKERQLPFSRWHTHWWKIDFHGCYGTRRFVFYRKSSACAYTRIDTEFERQPKKKRRSFEWERWQWQSNSWSNRNRPRVSTHNNSPSLRDNYTRSKALYSADNWVNG